MNYYYYVCLAFICNLRIFITWSANWCWYLVLDGKVITFIIKHKRPFVWQVNVKFYCFSRPFILDAWGQIVSTAVLVFTFHHHFPIMANDGPKLSPKNIFAGWYLVCKIVMVFFSRSCNKFKYFNILWQYTVRPIHLLLLTLILYGRQGIVFY